MSLHRRLLATSLVLILATAAGCSSTSSPRHLTASSPTHGGASTDGSGSASVSDPPPGTASATDSPSPSTHPVPASPLRTVSVQVPQGASLSVQVWAERDDHTCFDHAYGARMIQFLTVHPCNGLTRRLAITTVNGRQVGIATESTGFTDPVSTLYATVTAFRNLVEQNGTGSINDLLREGYRLPAGPTSVPDPDAFACLGQDDGVEVFDMWYLDGSTPSNDPVLEQLAQELFLQV